MANIFSIIADKKARFKEYSRQRKTNKLKVLQQLSKEAIKESELDKQIKEEKAKIKSAKGGGIMDKIKENAEIIRLRQIEKGANPTSPFLNDNRMSLQGSSRNIHEGVGRNIWEDMPSRNIWDEQKPKKRIWDK